MYKDLLIPTEDFTFTAVKDFYIHESWRNITKDFRIIKQSNNRWYHSLDPSVDSISSFIKQKNIPQEISKEFRDEILSLQKKCLQQDMK